MWSMQLFLMHQCTSFALIVSSRRNPLPRSRGDTQIHRVLPLENHTEPTESIRLKHSTTTLESEIPASRRRVLQRGLTQTMGIISLGAGTTLFQFPHGLLSAEDSAAMAYSKIYPTELVEPEAGSLQDGRELDLQRIREKQLQQQLKPGSSLSSRRRDVTSSSVTWFQPLLDWWNAVLWGAVLWLWSGSRSNPIVTPLANLIYDPEEEEWLRDRNDGLFADLPPAIYVLLTVVFVLAGAVVDLILVSLTQDPPTTAATGTAAAALGTGGGDRLQSLAGVLLISGAALEVGRLANGQKKPTRMEADRSTQLEQEFEDFANERLQLVSNRSVGGGNVHRSEVVHAFRRYYAKYRIASSASVVNTEKTSSRFTEFDTDNDTSIGLSDLEIERLLRAWSRRQVTPNGRPLAMSQAGFYSGLQINRDADIFGPQR